MPIGPRKFTFLHFIFRLFASSAGGICGTLTIFAIVISGSALITKQSEEPLSLFLILIIVLLGTMITNLVTTALTDFLDRDQHPHLLTAVTQVFILNLVLFIFAVPMYLVLSYLIIEQSTLAIAAAFHLLISIQATALMNEILGRGVYKMVSVYGVALGTMCSFTLIMVFYLFGQETFFLFIIAPLLTVSIEIFRSLAEFLYGVYYRLYGIDVLSSETVLSEEEQEPTEDEE